LRAAEGRSKEKDEQPSEDSHCGYCGIRTMHDLSGYRRGRRSNPRGLTGAATGRFVLPAG
jgi:hypothetical protein